MSIEEQLSDSGEDLKRPVDQNVYVETHANTQRISIIVGSEPDLEEIDDKTKTVDVYAPSNSVNINGSSKSVNLNGRPSHKKRKLHFIPGQKEISGQKKPLEMVIHLIDVKGNPKKIALSEENSQEVEYHTDRGKFFPFYKSDNETTLNGSWAQVKVGDLLVLNLLVSQQEGLEDSRLYENLVENAAGNGLSESRTKPQELYIAQTVPQGLAYAHGQLLRRAKEEKQGLMKLIKGGKDPDVFFDALQEHGVDSPYQLTRLVVSNYCGKSNKKGVRAVVYFHNKNPVFAWCDKTDRETGTLTSSYAGKEALEQLTKIYKRKDVIIELWCPDRAGMERLKGYDAQRRVKGVDGASLVKGLRSKAKKELKDRDESRRLMASRLGVELKD